MLVNVSWFFISHRLPIAHAALQAGLAFHVGTRFEPSTDREFLRAQGVDAHSVPFARGGVAPVSDLRSLFAIIATYRRLKPDLVHLVTLKPIILGGLAARLAGVPARVAAVPGLGYAFVALGPVAALRRTAIKAILRMALGGRNCTVVFQNPEDLRTFVDAGIVEERDTVLIRGAGVDMQQFTWSPEPQGRLRVLLAARMLREKGVADFVAAARLLRRQGVDAEFLLAGDPDPSNPGSVTREELTDWSSNGDVTWLGHVVDMSALLATVHVVCLPTYYGEGVPKVLIEAAAAGRPIVTTDLPGCRDVVIHDCNGLLVPPRDPNALAAALRTLLDDGRLRETMGRAGRDRVVEQFALEHVVGETVRLYKTAIARNARP